MPLSPIEAVNKEVKSIIPLRLQQTRYSGIDDSLMPWRQIRKYRCRPLPDAQ